MNRSSAVVSDVDVRRPCAAVAYVERDDGNDGKLLVVWNKRYGRWAMPGGKVEVGERPGAAVVRELLEETGLVAESAPTFLFEGAHGESVESSRGSYVYVFSVPVEGEPREVEPGCPVTWFTRDEFLRWGLAPDFYRRAFAAIFGNAP